MSMTAALARPIYRSTRELLSALLHDLAQPISALECSTEVVLQKRRSPEDYVAAIAGAKEISAGMRAQLKHFRELADAVQPCDCMGPVDTESALATAVEEVRPLAESLGISIEFVSQRAEVFGNEEKLISGLVWLLDYLLTRKRSLTLRLRVDQMSGGEVRLLIDDRDLPAAESSEDALTVAQTALATMGVEVRIEPDRDGLMVEVQLSSYRQPAAQTSVIVGDF